MNVQSTTINGLYVVTMKQVGEERGTIREFFRKSSFESEKINNFGPWTQINVTETRQGAIRGLHAESMQKLVGVISRGEKWLFVE